MNAQQISCHTSCSLKTAAKQSKQFDPDTFIVLWFSDSFHSKLDTTQWLAEVTSLLLCLVPFTAACIFFFYFSDSFDYANRHCLPHVTDGKTACRHTTTSTHISLSPLQMVAVFRVQPSTHRAVRTKNKAPLTWVWMVSVPLWQHLQI